MHSKLWCCRASSTAVMTAMLDVGSATYACNASQLRVRLHAFLALPNIPHCQLPDKPELLTLLCTLELVALLLDCTARPCSFKQQKTLTWSALASMAKEPSAEGSAAYDAETAGFLPLRENSQSFQTTVTADEAPKSWRGELLCCFSGCDVTAWASVGFFYLAPCVLFG